MKLPTISIIMPAYNSSKYIQSAIKSVMNQTFENWELIVIDDSSIDDTFQIIKNLSKEDERIRILQNKQNSGVSKTRNLGISVSKGQWIAFLDSDDMWEPNKLKKQIDHANKYGLKFIFTGSKYINENGDLYNGKFSVPEIVSYKELKRHNVISCSSVLISKELFSDVKMERDEIHEDYATWLKILKNNVLAYGINEPLIIYRISSKSKSGNKLKTIRMTYQVFRHVGLNPISSFYYMSLHIINSLSKYRKIFF